MTLTMVERVMCPRCKNPDAEVWAEDDPAITRCLNTRYTFCCDRCKAWAEADSPEMAIGAYSQRED